MSAAINYFCFLLFGICTILSCGKDGRKLDDYYTKIKFDDVDHSFTYQTTANIMTIGDPLVIDVLAKKDKSNTWFVFGFEVAKADFKANEFLVFFSPSPMTAG